MMEITAALHRNGSQDGAQMDQSAVQREIEVTDLRKFGQLNQDHINEYVNQAPVSPQIRQEAVDLRGRLFADKAWVGRYLSGGQEEAKTAALLALVLTAPIQRSK
jgi:hypothetical protein